MIKAGIFDIGGVLQVQDVNGPLSKDVAKTFKISEDEFEKFRLKMEPYLLDGTLEEDQYWDELKKRTGSQKHIPNDSLLLREYIKNFSVNEDVLKIVKDIKKRGVILACLTDTIKPHTKYNKMMGLYSEFQVQVFSHDVHMIKPDKRIYELTLERLGVLPQEAFYVDDRKPNLVPAKELGMTTILFESPHQLRQELEKLDIR